MVPKEKVVSLLGSGVSIKQVAQAVGCDISYISQLLEDETIAAEVAELRTAGVVKYKELDNTYDEIEQTLQNRLKEVAPMIMKPDQIIRALQFVNGAKRKSNSAVETDIDAGQIVKLSLPQVTINNYKITMNGAMVEVGGRSLTPMPSADLMKTLESVKSDNGHEKKVPELSAKSPIPNSTSVPERRIVNENTI